MLAPGLTKSFRFGVVLFALFFATSADAGHTIQQGGPGHTIRPTSEGARLAFQFTAPAASAPASITPTRGNAITCARASTGTYQTSATTLATAASGTCRVDYRGLLVEESRTNSALQSSTFTDVAWLGTSLTVTGDSHADPFSTSTADTLADTASGGFIRQNSIPVSGAATGSYWILNASSTALRVFLRNGSDSTTICTLDTAATASWARYSCSGTANASSNVQTFLYPGGPSTSGSIFAWGAQVEAGAFSTSYIPTTTTAVTRSADVVDEGAITLPATYSLSATVNPEGLAGTETSLYATDGTHTRSLAVDASGHAVCTYGATSDSTTSTLSVGAATKIACKYDGTKIYACLAGACTAGTTAASDGATAMTHVYVGSNGSANFANGFISQACAGKSGACAP